MRFAAFFLALVAAAHCSVTCKDDNGNSVDWYAAIKFPDGLSYTVLTDGSGTFQDASSTLDSGGALYNTVNQVFNGDASSYVLYNDQTPDGKQHSTFGHSKGVMGFSGSSGFYLIHSVPHWPSAVDNGYSVASSAHDNGQSFLCITMDADNINKVAQNWQYTRPKIYSSALGDSQLSDVQNIISGTYIHDSAQNMLPVSSKGGMSFDYFAKTQKWHKDIYENFIATTYETDLKSETWQNGVGKIASSCTSDGFAYNTMDVSGISLSGQTWPETKDHSKWCITSGSSPNRVCIGDINRQYGQEHRSGGMMCFENAAVYSEFDNAITGTYACGGTPLASDMNTGTTTQAENPAPQPWAIGLVVASVVVAAAATVIGIVVVVRRRRATEGVEMMP